MNITLLTETFFSLFRLGWSNIELLLGQFQDRLEFGVRRELIDLCRLASVDGARARVLFNGGSLCFVCNEILSECF